jgi:6-pyruvoyltetrahydropterin/6-carboxytetrahydropterin synthase
MFSIRKEFHFSASHQLRDLPEGHQCARLHGHNYVLVVELSASQPDDVGFVLDYGELSFVKDIVDELDHRHLNDLFSFNPTSENLCREFFLEIEEALRDMDNTDNLSHMAIELSETPKTNCRYERGLV